MAALASAHAPRAPFAYALLALASFARTRLRFGRIVVVVVIVFVAVVVKLLLAFDLYIIFNEA